MSDTEGLRASREARADLAQRGARPAPIPPEVLARMVNAAVYRYEHHAGGGHHTAAPPATEVRWTPPPPPRPRTHRAVLEAARSYIDDLNLKDITTSSGVLRYVDTGVRTGPPALLVHGIFGGADAALRQLGPFVPDGFRVLAPCRFGYLGSALPYGATPGAQADALVTLLDRRRIKETVVIAGSAGVTSALQLAIRHPARVSALVLMSSNAPGTQTPSGFLDRVRAHVWWGSNTLMWLMQRSYPRALLEFMGVPKGYSPTAADQALIDAELDGIFPVDRRAAGARFDMFVSNPDINSGYRFGNITAPTLVVHAKDDPVAPYAGAVALAEAIPGARLLTVDSGGHLLLGEHPELMVEVQSALHAAVG